MSNDTINVFPMDRRIGNVDLLERFNRILVNADSSKFQNVIWSEGGKGYLPRVAVYLMDNRPTYAVFYTDTITTPTRYVMSLFVTRDYEEAMLVHSQMLYESIHKMNYPVED